jgi:cytoskeletal protein CcmA (bactofilin family)
MSNTQRPSAAVRHTVVEEGTEFKGALTSSCPIDVRGKIEGDVTTPALTVSATGAVHGRAKVGAVRSEGELSGEFDAESVELAGSVRDNTVIRARSLEVKLASTPGKVLQVMFGECELAIGAEPTDADEVAPVAATTDDVVAAIVAIAAAEAAPLLRETPAAEATSLPAAAEAVSAPADAPAAEAAASPTGDDEPEEGSVAEGGSSSRKKRPKKQHDVAADAPSGWTNPPSRPPPAN